MRSRGLIIDFSRNGAAIGDQLWQGEPADGDGMTLGPAYALSNENGLFVALDVTNTTDETFIMHGATFVQVGRQFSSDPQIDVVTFELFGGNTATMVFGTQALAQAEGTPITLQIEGGSPERQADISAETALTPLAS